MTSIPFSFAVKEFSQATRILGILKKSGHEEEKLGRIHTIVLDELYSVTLQQNPLCPELPGGRNRLPNARAEGIT